MKHLLALILILPFFYSCNDGDIIVKDFNFDNVSLKTCEGIGNYVFYKENTQSQESLSLQIGTRENLYENAGTQTFSLNSSNSFVNYRRYDGPLGNNYFCNNIPPSTPKVIEEYTAVSGYAMVIVTFEYDNGDRPNGNKPSSNNASVNGKSMQTTIHKHVQIILKDLVLVKNDEQIVVETIDMGTIENVRVVEE